MRKNNWIKLLLLAASFSPVFSFSQVLQQWVQRYSSPGWASDKPNDMTVDRFGNVYITGLIRHTFEEGCCAEDFVTIKYNAAGVKQWAATYNGPSSRTDIAYAITTDVSGNVYVTGGSAHASTSSFVTIKYNSSGIQQWLTEDNNGSFMHGTAYDIAVDVAGNVYVTGQTSDSTNKEAFFTSGITTIKYNASGILQWVQKLQRPESRDTPVKIALDLAGNVYVSGQSFYNTLPPGTSQGVTIKYSQAGNILWVKRSEVKVFDMVLDAFGNVYITGHRGTFKDCATTKYNTNGVEQWKVFYTEPAPKTSFASAIAIDLLGNVYITGGTLLFDFNNGVLIANYITIKYNGAGIQKWVSIYDAGGSDEAQGIAVDILGNVYVTGKSSRGFGYDYTTVKYNSAGIQVWDVRYNGTANFTDDASEIALHSSGPIFSDILSTGPNIYVCGFSEGIGTDRDIVTVKYSQPFVFSFELLTQAGPSSNRIVGDQPAELTRPHMLSNFPNPFSVSTKIVYELPADSRVSIKVYDISGNQVASLVQEEKKRGSYSIDYNAGRLKNGVYFCTINAESLQGRFTQTRQMIVIHE